MTDLRCCRQYFNGSRISNGCLRIIPGSHRHPTVLLSNAEQKAQGNPPSVFDAELEQHRAAAGVVQPGGWKDGAPADVEMPGEVSLELGPHELLVRNTRIFHATHVNKEDGAAATTDRLCANAGQTDVHFAQMGG